MNKQYRKNCWENGGDEEELTDGQLEQLQKDWSNSKCPYCNSDLEFTAYGDEYVGYKEWFCEKCDKTYKFCSG